MTGRDGAFGILMGAAVGTLALLLTHCSAQEPPPASCAFLSDRSPIEDLTLCAERGDVEAQFNLGLLYAVGGGVPRDDAKAVCWWRLAAEQGHVDAQFELGFMYKWGDGVVAEDDSEAVRWFQLAAEQGQVEAQIYLGQHYFGGEGVPRNYVLADMWLQIAAMQGGPLFEEAAQETRRLFEQRMTREQIAEAQRLSREWIETHPQDGGN